MKTLKKLTLSAIAFALLLGGKPVLAEELDSAADLLSETEVVTAEAGITDTSAVEADDSVNKDLLLSNDISADSSDTVTGSSSDTSVSVTDGDEVATSVIAADGNEADTSVTATDGTDTSVTETDTDKTDTDEADTSETEKVKHLTVLNGVDYSLVYDYEYYSANEDVKAAFGDDEEQTLYNFVRWGMLSQRQGIATFDEVSYRYAYQDLRLALAQIIQPIICIISIMDTGKAVRKLRGLKRY